MDRTIKYRGISVITNKWVYGSLICDSYHPKVVNKVEEVYRIVTSSRPYKRVVVKNESITQFTGRLDKIIRKFMREILSNGTEIEVIDNIYNEMQNKILQE